MKETEAKKKWCPYAMTIEYAEGVGVSANRVNLVSIIDDEDELDSADSMPAMDCSCLASGCMMWRWSKYDVLGDEIPSDTHGYCGLAGKP